MTTLTQKIPKKRNGVYYRNNREYVSITKILGDVLAKPALLYWYGQQAAAIALKDPTLTDKEVMAQMALNVKKTQERGQYIHNCAEQMPDIVTEIDIPEYRGYLQALRGFWEVFEPITIHNEIEAFSDMYMTACRVDKVCTLKTTGPNVFWSLDFKTGKEIYKEVGIQLVFGKHALKEDHGIDVKHTGAVLLMDDGSYKFQETKDTIEDFAHLRKVYDWVKRKD